ncbi:uncharacterized protein PY17X_1338600 [Plasmodium yoelii]|uniref:Asparagine-rich protein n=2 Tax=Plasmodium yoelii TaxID=5861 RepID=A0AAF0B578_PLAYO|nr:uncharacterized protein PY17X_1338600 [Plasmodium yoelii]WBY60088.1 hypothetical protein Py17XNL_001303243 [Plasmodium yoelii yoelii]CDU20006.1 conserved Plasmodium protein, unknown function [Plasmodium yoelii]VTZ80764.1 conserved Plasmodium protein, unknown function [Plasmodium yoelii]|eukprot:XP_723801.2 uncharacterized protein PY17X_1338600 [Plasmodium yoelii]
MDKHLRMIARNIFVNGEMLWGRPKKCIEFFFDKKYITTNISENKEIKTKNIEHIKLRNFKKNKNIIKDNNNNNDNEDAYVLNGKILYAPKNKKKQINELQIKSPAKKIKNIDNNTSNVYYNKLGNNNIKKNNLIIQIDQTDAKLKREIEDVDNYTNKKERVSIKLNGDDDTNFKTTCFNNNNNINLNLDTTIYNNYHHNNFSDINPNYTQNKKSAHINFLSKSDNTQNVESEFTQFSNTSKSSIYNEVPLFNTLKAKEVSDNGIVNTMCNSSTNLGMITQNNFNLNSNVSSNSPQEKNNKNDTIDTSLNNNNNNNNRDNKNNEEIKQDIYEVLNEINCSSNKKEIEVFLNNFFLYKSKKPSSILGNYISFYFCNILSEDLRNLKHSCFDGVKLCVNTFLSTIKELDEKQLSKMTNIYLEDYFLKIFKILKEHNLNLHFDNITIDNIKLLYIYNILGITRNDGKRIKKENIKKFLYQYICVDNKDIALLKNTTRMKFLSNIIKNGVTTRMHVLVNLSYDVSAYNTLTENCFIKTNFKNINLELVFENQLENPFFSLQSPDSIDLKSSGWYLVDVNQILNGNLPYE